MRMIAASIVILAGAVCYGLAGMAHSHQHVQGARTLGVILVGGGAMCFVIECSFAYFGGGSKRNQE